MTDEQTQPPQTSSLSGFEGLAGIDDARNVQARPLSALEKLLAVGEESIKKYAPLIDFYTQQALNKDGSVHLSLPLLMIYNELYHELQDVKLKDVLYSENNLKEFIIANVNRDNDENSAKILGLYTSVLLEILMNRYEQEGKQRRFYINGFGNRFDYLFYLARNVDELVVDNFCGDYICEYAGSYSKIDRIVGMNLKGNNVLNFLGYNGIVRQAIGVTIDARSALSHLVNNGFVEQVIGVNIVNTKPSKDIHSDNVLKSIAVKGKANQIIGVDIDSINAFKRNSNQEDYTNQIIGVNIIGPSSFKHIAERDGQVNQILAKFIDGNLLFYDVLLSQGRINQVVALSDVLSRNMFKRVPKTIISDRNRNIISEVKEGVIGEIILCNSDATIEHNYFITYGKLITGEEAKARLSAISQEAHLDEITALCRAMKTAGYPKILEIADELYALRPAVPAGFFERK